MDRRCDPQLLPISRRPGCLALADAVRWSPPRRATMKGISVLTVVLSVVFGNMTMANADDATSLATSATNKIHVISASYGANCNVGAVGNVTALVAEECEG